MSRVSPLFGVVLLALLQPANLAAHDVRVSQIDGDLPVQRITDKIHVVHGPQEFPNPDTGGFMNNPGFVITSEGVVVVDPGSSVQVGEKLLESIAAITNKPVIAVFNTHVHGDHWLGNQAIKAAFPDVEIYAHVKMLERIDQGEGDEWIRLFSRMTAGATDGTRVVAPTTGLEGNESMTFGDTGFQLYHPEKAHSDTDLVIEVTDQKSLFAGDIVTNRRVQSARPMESDILGQIEAVKRILQSNNETVIPGHGRSGGREIARHQLEYLTDLYDSVKKHYERGFESYEMKASVMEEMQAYSSWYNFDELGRVIDAVYLRVEEEDFDN